MTKKKNKQETYLFKQQSNNSATENHKKILSNLIIYFFIEFKISWARFSLKNFKLSISNKKQVGKTIPEALSIDNIYNFRL